MYKNINVLLLRAFYNEMLLIKHRLSTQVYTGKFCVTNKSDVHVFCIVEYPYMQGQSIQMSHKEAWEQYISANIIHLQS